MRINKNEAEDEPEECIQISKALETKIKKKRHCSLYQDRMKSLMIRGKTRKGLLKAGCLSSKPNDQVQALGRTI